MSEFENRRRVIARSVCLLFSRLYGRSFLSFSELMTLAWALTQGQRRLCYTKCRGTTRTNSNGVSRQRILARLHTYPESEVILYFERESSNFFDTNAIKVMANVYGKGNACIGYLSADLAREVAPLLDEGYTAVVFFLGITGIGKENLGVNFSFTILPIPTYHNKQKSPQLAS